MSENIEFDILGFKLRLRADQQLEGGVMPHEVIDYVRREADKILSKAPTLAPAQAMVLVATQIATERLALEREYRENIDKLQGVAKDALQFIDEATST